jgi:hypothetical protein
MAKLLFTGDVPQRIEPFIPQWRPLRRVGRAGVWDQAMLVGIRFTLQKGTPSHVRAKPQCPS